MTNISMKNLKDIMDDLELITDDINDLKPFSITFDEVNDLCEDIRAKLVRSLKNVTIIGKVNKAFRKEGLL